MSQNDLEVDLPLDEDLKPMTTRLGKRMKVRKVIQDEMTQIPCPAMEEGDTVLLINQSDSSKNGVYRLGGPSARSDTRSPPIGNRKQRRAYEAKLRRKNQAKKK